MIKKGKRRVRGKRASAVRRNSRRKRGHSLPSKNSLTWHSESHMPEVAGEKDPLEKEAEKTASKATGLNSSVQMKADGVSKNSVSSSFVKTLNQTRDSGTPLPLLRIERTAFDVLLDTLPWPISVHRYSWMKKLLTVEW